MVDAAAIPPGFGLPIIRRFIPVWCLRDIYEREEKALLEAGAKDDDFSLRLVRVGLSACDEAAKQLGKQIRRELGWED